MKTYQIDDFTNGWFIGNFQPTIFSTRDFEVSVKWFNEGDKERNHKQLIATELTIVVSGTIRMNTQEFSERSIIEIEPDEPCEFESVTKSILVCVKFPSLPNDKILV